MLGPLEAWHDGVQVPLGDQQQRFVLVVLLLHANRPVSTFRLTEIVWGGNPARRDLVRGYINKLRNAFQDNDDVRIETTPTGYLLRIGADQLDTSRFDRLRAEAEELRGTDPRRAIALLRTAVGLWRGGFLEDIDVDRVGGPEVIPPDESRLDAIGDLAELELETGDHRSARDRLRPVVRADPASQKHAELLMRALLAGGDRVAAVRVFHGTRQALAELGVEPGFVLRNLSARAERGEPAGSLPSRPAAFTGRGTELAVIEAAASAVGERRAVWVSGTPGVGKTGLAVEAAYRLRGRFPDGQVLVRLNGFTPEVPALTVAEALTQLLVELGVPTERIPATVSRKIALYRAELCGTRTLVVLDNAASPEQIRPLLPEEPGCFAIATSRKVGELDTGEHIRLSPLPPEDAVGLFHALTDPTRAGGRSAEVVRRCGFLPMPIKVAAALLRRYDQWPLDRLLRLLEESGPWCADTGELEDATAVRASYQQLGHPQRAMFRLLGHLPGPDLEVTGAAAFAQCDVPKARILLGDLHEVSLVEETGPERYQLLDPLKEFAAGQPPTVPTEHADATLRLLDFYLVTLAAAVGAGYPFDRAQLPTVHRSSPAALTFASRDTALGWIAAERDNLVAAIHYAATHDLPGHAWRLAVLMCRHFNATSEFEAWIETMELAWKVVAPGLDEDYGQAHVLLRLAVAHNRAGRPTKALELAAQALPKWVRLGEVPGEAATLCAIAVPTMELGRYDQAIAHFAAALAKYEQSADQRGHAHALSMLGCLNELHGNLGVALRQHRTAVRMLHQIGHLAGVAHALNNLGSVQQRLGLLSEALASHTEAHGHAGAAGDRRAMVHALNNIGNVHRLRGKLPEARRYQERATVVAAELSDADLHTRLDLDRGATARAAGDLAEALRAYQAALERAASTDGRAHQARAHRHVAEALHTLGNHERAIPHWDSAEAEFARLGLPDAVEIRSERAALVCACR